MSALADSGLDFSRREAVFLTHRHGDHTGGLAALFLYPWSVREAMTARFRRSASTGCRGPGAHSPGGIDIPSWPGRRAPQVPVVVFEDAVVLVHHVADLSYLERHGVTGAALDRMVALHTDITEVGGVASRAGVRELILSYYLPAEPNTITDAEWAERAGPGFRGKTTAGRDGLRRALAAWSG